MPALHDIENALAKMGPVERGRRRFVLLGKYAMRAVQVDTHEHREPQQIGGFAVVKTEDFVGWEIVDRPVRGLL